MTDDALTPDEIADATIDFMESIGPALMPWQATTLRAMLAYPTGTRFAVATQRQPMSHSIADDLNRLQARRICTCQPNMAADYHRMGMSCPVHDSEDN